MRGPRRSPRCRIDRSQQPQPQPLLQPQLFSQPQPQPLLQPQPQPLLQPQPQPKPPQENRRMRTMMIQRPELLPHIV